MMANTGHKIYGAVEFQSYHDGTMPAAERRVLEGAALEDPFLADALEGYAFSKQGPVDIARLKEQLRNAQHGKRRRVMTILPGWWRIAALFVLVVGSCWGVYRMWNSNDAGMAATPETAVFPRTKDSVPSFSPLDSTPASSPSSNAVVDLPGAKKVAAPVTIPTAAPKPTDMKALETSLAGKTEGVKLDRSPAPSLSPASRIQAQERRDEDVKGVTVFKGKVVDSRGAPVPNVSITAADSKVRTTTDVNGYFSLKAGDSAFNATVSAAGFNARQAFLAAPSQNTIVLKEDLSSLNEVVVMARKRSVNPSVSNDVSVRSDSMPVGGWNAFQTYLEGGRNARAGVRGEGSAGTVVLSFATDKRGTPSKIVVEQQLCAACDAAAVRVLTSGPKWKLPRGKRARVSIPFD